MTECGITTVAHKIAGRVYRLLKHGEKYVRQEIAAYEALFQLKQTKNLAKKATELGYLLIPVPVPVPVDHPTAA